MLTISVAIFVSVLLSGIYLNYLRGYYAEALSYLERTANKVKELGDENEFIIIKEARIPEAVQEKEIVIKFIKAVSFILPSAMLFSFFAILDIQNSLLNVFVAGGTALVVIGTIWCRSRAKELSLICQYYHVAVTAFENKEENNVN